MQMRHISRYSDRRHDGDDDHDDQKFHEGESLLGGSSDLSNPEFR
jgi:hypothetical protein